VPFFESFTYLFDPIDNDSITPGRAVRVSFGKRNVFGFIFSLPFQTLKPNLDSSKIKKISEILPYSLSPERLKLCQWTVDYYKTYPGEVFQAALPLHVLTQSGKARKKERPRSPLLSSLNPDQEKVVSQFDFESPLPVLLKGVTGSGKTEVYIHLAKKMLDTGKSVLFLVPEISLTPQLISRLENGLDREIAVWHSASKDTLRKEHWLKLESGELMVAAGARSAIFLPLKNLGLIVVDEEHDSSYKQEERFKYHARDLSIVRAKFEKAKVLLGTATPSFETIYNVERGRYLQLELPARHAASEKPIIEIVDLSKEEKIGDLQAPLAKYTVDEIQRTLQSGKQVMVFLNRRGFAAFLLCTDCSHTFTCPSCSISLSVHSKIKKLKCHQCGHEENIPFQCPTCNGVQLAPIGAGTQSVEEQLPNLIPEMKAIRLDRDQITSNTRLEEILNSFKSGEFNTLIGTQMLVKGHDFHAVTLVVVIMADAFFKWPDFRAPERAHQILTQVSGRAGRGDFRGKVIIQTYTPEHPVLKTINDPIETEKWITLELEMRKFLDYPPYVRLTRFRFEHSDSELCQNSALFSLQQFKNFIKEEHILGPSQSFLSKTKGVFRYDIYIKCADISVMHKCFLSARSATQQNKVQLNVDVDPIGI
jgi:primosomal protein N' (replication factor Y) (superfamily II helicase)